MSDREGTLKELDALEGCGVKINRRVGGRYEDIDVSDVAGAAAEAIRALEEELGKANERIEELETELEEAS